MNPADDIGFEAQLRALEPRRPPAEWKSMLLPKPMTPWFPKPLMIGLTFVWVATAGFILFTPENEILGPPIHLPVALPPGNDYLLGFNSTEDLIR